MLAPQLTSYIKRIARHYQSTEMQIKYEELADALGFPSNVYDDGPSEPHEEIVAAAKEMRSVYEEVERVVAESIKHKENADER